MAAWIMHLRIAEKLFGMGLDVIEAPFYVGTLAPDCGRMIGDFGYDPPKELTHWHKNLPDRLQSNMLFYEKYCKNERDPYRRSFYLGYFIHIVVDTFYIDGMVMPIIHANMDQWHRDPWSIKKDWFNYDYAYADSHPDFRPLKGLYGIEKFDNVYLDFFSKDDFTRRLNELPGIFARHHADRTHVNKFVTVEMLDNFAEECPKKIAAILEDLGEIKK